MPERLDLKRRVLAEIDAACPTDALIGSSTSGLLPSDLQAGLAHPERLFVAHPYNPVYLLPLVEIVGGKATAPAAIERARAVLDAIGMKGVVIAREIEAFVGDRLLEALWREALWLIKDDICDVETLDDVIRYSFGLRWAQMGLFQTYRIAGGEAGMRHFLAQFGPCLKWPWTKLTDVVDLDEALIEKIGAQSDEQAAGLSIRELERIRDENLVGILHALKASRGGEGWGAGKLLADFERRLLAGAGRPQVEGDLSNYSQLPSCISKGPHREVDVLRVERGRHLRADARRALRHHGEEEARDEDAALVERFREILGEPRLEEHHRNDRRHAEQYLEARPLDAGAKALRMRLQERAPVVGFDGDLQRVQGPGRDRGAKRVREEIGPRPLAQQVDDRLRRGDEAAHAAAERFAERPVTMSTRFPAPVSAGVPRPFSPRWPVAWQSSTSTSAS